MDAIGGYFSLDLNSGSSYYKATEMVALNTGRNCLEYLLRAKKFSKLYIPYFTCDAILEPLNKLKLDFEFYQIDENLEPLFDFSKVKKNEVFLYTNYYGLKQQYISELTSNIDISIIIDNAQAFFSPPNQYHVDYFYSPRKFIGLADGGYLFTNTHLNEDFEIDRSVERMSHLLERIDTNAENGYPLFCKNDSSLIGQDIKRMSKLTTRLLGSVDYNFIKERRRQNYKYLFDRLDGKNLLKLSPLKDEVPLVFPFRTKNTNLRSQLIKHRIYCAQYWPNVLDWCSEEMIEYKLTQEIIALPIDQRYNEQTMDIIFEIVSSNL